MPLQKLQTPSRLTRWRDQMREKRNRDEIQNIQVRQLSQNEDQNLRADELASPPGSARVVVSVAKDKGREIIDALVENQPLPSLKIDGKAIDGRMTIDAHNRRVIECNAPKPTSALNDGRAYAMVGLDYPPPVPEKDTPVGLGISNVDLPTPNVAQPLPPKTLSQGSSSSSSPSFAISHVIDCSKGLESTALLLSPSIRDEFKQVLRAQREVEAAEGKLTHMSSLTGDLEVDIACLQDEIARGKIGKGKGKQKVRDSAASEQEEDVSLDTLSSLLVQITAHRENLAASLQTQREELQFLQNHLNAQLDEAFTRAEILEPHGSVTQDEEVARAVHFKEDDVHGPTLVDGCFVTDAKQSTAPHVMPTHEVEEWMHGVPEGAWAGDVLEDRWQVYAKAILEGIIDDGGEVLASDSVSVQEQARRAW